MPSLPIPLISSLILGFLLVRFCLLGRRHGPLITLLAICMAQGLIIVLAQHYHVTGFLFVQPITATLVPAMAWLAFQTSAVRRLRWSDMAHGTGSLAALLSLAIFPEFLNVLIPALFCGYGGAVLWFASKGADGTPMLRLEAGDLPGQIWQIVGAALIASAASDVMIVAAQYLGVAHLQPWIISIYSSIMLLIVGGLGLSAGQGASTVDREAGREPAPDNPVSDEDTQIIAQLDRLMDEQALYLNPNLTLSQLSRKMRVPTKQLSGAINRVSGQNMSRYVNASRIKAAQDALLQQQSVTNAMLLSGFNTKSHFNREFLRVTGQSPSDWLADQNA